MRTYVYIAQSLDGFIAKVDGDIKWLEDFPNPSGSDFGFSDFMNGIDALLMGRNTFEKVQSFGFWPYNKPVYVVSNSLLELGEEYTGKAYLIKGTLNEMLSELKSKGYESIYLDGGKLIQSFLKEDLVDSLTITTMPILLGDGIPLFGRVLKESKWENIDTEVYNKALVKSRYMRVR